MQELKFRQTASVSGGVFEHEIGVYTLGVAGSTAFIQGALTAAAGMATKNKPVVVAGACGMLVGATMAASAYAFEYMGYSDIDGWYGTAKSTKGWLTYVGML